MADRPATTRGDGAKRGLWLLVALGTLLVAGCSANPTTETTNEVGTNPTAATTNDTELQEVLERAVVTDPLRDKRDCDVVQVTIVCRVNVTPPAPTAPIVVEHITVTAATE